MLTIEGTPVSVRDPGQCIVAIYVLSGCMIPLNLVEMMLEVMAGIVICLVAEMVFICSSANLTCLVLKS